jgi:hypothetical protein
MFFSFRIENDEYQGQIGVHTGIMSSIQKCYV